MNSYIESLKQKSVLKIMMVCLGNICRSPMAAAVMHNRSNTIDQPTFFISSSGTGAWHVGEGPNVKSKMVWEEAGYNYNHIAQQFIPSMFADQDLVLVMDKSNYQNVLDLSKSNEEKKKVFFLRQFDPNLMKLDPNKDYEKLEIPDPYYEPISAYRDVLHMVESAVSGLIETLTARN